MHVDPAGAVTDQHRGGGVHQVLPPYDGPLGVTGHGAGAVHESDDLGHDPILSGGRA